MVPWRCHSYLCQYHHPNTSTPNPSSSSSSSGSGVKDWASEVQGIVSEVLGKLEVQVVPIEALDSRRQVEGGELCVRKTSSNVDLNRCVVQQARGSGCLVASSSRCCSGSSSQVMTLAACISRRQLCEYMVALDTLRCSSSSSERQQEQQQAVDAAATSQALVLSCYIVML